MTNNLEPYGLISLGEINEIDHQAMQHMLTLEAAIDWNGFYEQNDQSRVRHSIYCSMRLLRRELYPMLT